jgi:1-acyl-sn-glycerol-3-phosphate acyltransferase
VSRTSYRVSHAVVAPAAKLLWRPTVTGTENVPLTGGVVLASNHLSFIDSFAIPIVAPRPVSFLAKSEYFTGSGFGGALRRGFFESTNAIPVDRHSSRAAQESLDSALAVLRAGRAFGIYPEGTRSRDGRLYKGRTGVAWLALTAGVPVVPVGLRGTDEVQPVGRSFPRIGAHVTVRFGEPIRPDGYRDLPAGKARRQLTDEVMEAVAALSGQDRADGYNELPPESPGAAVGI